MHGCGQRWDLSLHSARSDLCDPGPRRQSSHAAHLRKWSNGMNRNVGVQGGCMCGQVRYAAVGVPLYTGYCHCRSCRHHSGAAVAGMLVFQHENVRFTAGGLSIYASSPGIERGFCSHCGTSLTWKGHGLISLHIGTLDDPDAHAPTLHWRSDERSPWCDVGRGLPEVTMTFTGPD